MKLNFVIGHFLWSVRPGKALSQFLKKRSKSLKTCARFIMTQSDVEKKSRSRDQENTNQQNFYGPSHNFMRILMSFGAISLRLYSSFSPFKLIKPKNVLIILLRLTLVALLLLIDK